MSGAGRTEAMHVFEDLGYYCVDNLPSSLLADLVRVNESTEHEGGRRRLAVVCDSRNGDFFGDLEAELSSMQEAGVSYKTLFLDAADDKLIARYKSSRRRHPLCTDGTTIWQGIQRERLMLMGLRDRADYVIDTTDMLPQKLRSTIRGLFATGSERKGLAITVYSFGFKHGAPYDADLVMDVRFLPNPYYDPELRPLTGLDAPVRDFVRMRERPSSSSRNGTICWTSSCRGTSPRASSSWPSGVGCTGGQHRSVALAEATGDYLKSKGYRVSVAHRDLRLAERGHDLQRESDNVLDARAGGGKEA